MNKFIRFPLFLGAVCFVFSSALAVTVAICQPVIDRYELEKVKKAYESIYSDITAIEVTNLKQPTLQSVAEINHTQGTSFAYTVITKEAQSGKISFILGINSSGSIDGYQMVSNNSWGAGAAYNDAQKVLENIKNYTVGGTFYMVTGATNSGKMMKNAVDDALNHFNANYKGVK